MICGNKMICKRKRWLYFPSLRTGNRDRIYTFRASEQAITTGFILSEPQNGQSRPDLRFPSLSNGQSRPNLRFPSLRTDNHDRIYAFRACEPAIATGFILSPTGGRTKPTGGDKESVSLSLVRDYVNRFNAADDESTVQLIPNSEAAGFLSENIPCFECPDKENNVENVKPLPPR
jgi:hypothetical protein